MDFTLNNEQKLLQDSVDSFIENEYGFEARQQVAAGDEGFSRAMWRRFAELGWLAASLPEEHGGLGGSSLDIAVLMEAFGRGLVLEPFVPTIILGGGLIASAGSDAQKTDLIPRLVEGELLLAFAHSEPHARFDLARVETSATINGDCYVISGHKSVVHNAAAADKLIVSARTSAKRNGGGDVAGITLFLVNRETEGLTLRPYPTVDGLRAAEVSLEDVRVSSEDIVGEIDGALPQIECVVDVATAALCAEAVGAMDGCVTATREYLKIRSQFGVRLSSFQALQHRAVDMYIEYEMSKAVAFRAAASIDAALKDTDATARALAASVAKVQIGRSGRFVGQQAIQLHGAMGMTDELPVGHWFKRLRTIDTLFGNVDYHLERFATLEAVTGESPTVDVSSTQVGSLDTGGDG